MKAKGLTLLYSLFCGFALLLVFACGRAQEKPAIQAPESKAITDSATPPSEPQAIGYGEKDVPKTPSKTPGMTRKIIRNGEVNLVVKYYEPFFGALQKRILQAGGYIAQIQVNRGSGQVSSAMIVLRLRPEELDRTISWLKEQGIVTSEKINADDISEQYYDLKARLGNALKFEERLLEMLKTQTGKLEDVLMVEEKLNQVREQIEQFEGKLRYFDNLVDLATLTLNISVEEKYVAPQAPGFGERAVHVWRESVDSLKDFIQGLGLLVVGILPWIIPVAILALVVFYVLRLVWRLFRRERVKKSE